MLRNDSHTGHLIELGYTQRLHAGVVLNAPQVNDALGVAGDEAVETLRAVDADKWVLVAFETHNVSLLVRIPDEHLEIEADRDEDLVTLGVSNLPDSFGMSLQSLDGLELSCHILRSRFSLDDGAFGFLFLLLLLVYDLAIAQLPQFDARVLCSKGDVLNVGQVNDASGGAVLRYKPGSCIRQILNVVHVV